jgi:Na+-translocating ferredoxin:NAD+ oxidoreductase RNF subunit RnfB
MILCPIALAIGCKKCIAFPVCPFKAVIGDYKDVPKADSKAPSSKAKTRKKPGKSR